MPFNVAAGTTLGFNAIQCIPSVQYRHCLCLRAGIFLHFTYNLCFNSVKNNNNTTIYKAWKHGKSYHNGAIYCPEYCWDSCVITVLTVACVVMCDPVPVGQSSLSVVILSNQLARCTWTPQKDFNYTLFWCLAADLRRPCQVSSLGLFLNAVKALLVKINLIGWVGD